MYPREYFDTFWRGGLRDEIFVAMPFSDEFSPVWELAVEPAIEADLSLKAHRVDTTIISGNVVTEIMDGIANARLVLADISICTEGKWKGQRNGNVMYEVGLTHAIRQPPENLLIRSDSEEITFDVAGIRVHKYDRDRLEETRAKLARLLRDSLGEVEQVKALRVHQVVDALDADSAHVMLRSADAEYFSVNRPETMGEVMAHIADGCRVAVPRLLEFGIFRYDFSHKRGAYAYHWTEFGRAVLELLKSQ